MACIYIEGKRHYLGPWDSPGIEEARQRVWAEYLAKRKVQIGPNEAITVAILVNRFHRAFFVGMKRRKLS